MKKLLILLLLLPSLSWGDFIMKDLIDVLRTINNSKTNKVAMDLQSINENQDSYDFIIRKANLSNTDAVKIALALNSIELNNGPKLHTISLSFNQKLKDDGVIEIINNIPQDTSVIAFVECGITDLAGQKIIDWAYKNDHLIAVYLEGNNFTDTMYSKFKKLKSDKPNLTILSKWANEGFEKMVKETYK